MVEYHEDIMDLSRRTAHEALKRCWVLREATWPVTDTEVRRFARAFHILAVISEVAPYLYSPDEDHVDERLINVCTKPLTPLQHAQLIQLGDGLDAMYKTPVVFPIMVLNLEIMFDLEDPMDLALLADQAMMEAQQVSSRGLIGREHIRDNWKNKLNASGPMETSDLFEQMPSDDDDDPGPKTAAFLMVTWSTCIVFLTFTLSIGFLV